MPSSSISRALNWQRETATAAAEKMRSAAGVRKASEKSWQLSASSLASSSASGGARVFERWRGGRKILTAMGCAFIRKGTTQRNYAGAPGDSHLNDMWRACNSWVVVPCSHARLDCRGGHSEFFGFPVIKIAHLKQT